MPLLHAIVLGIVQGLTEFLPVSSSGHLILTRWLFGWGTGDGGVDKAFDVAVHVGTLVGAAGFLRADLSRLGGAAWRSVRERRIGTHDDRMPWLLIVATVPAVVTGALLESTIAERLGVPWLVAVMLIVGSGLLWAADRFPERAGYGDLTMRHSTLIGLAQALALQPGVSRSGATLAAARSLGYNRDAAARFSFLLSLPLIAGAGLYEAYKLLGQDLPAGTGAALAVGVVAAAVTSVIAVWGVLAVVRRRSFLPFVVYRVAVGVVVLALLASPLR